MSIKKKILAMIVGPILTLGIISVIFTLTRVKSAMVNEIQDALKGTAAATLAHMIRIQVIIYRQAMVIYGKAAIMCLSQKAWLMELSRIQEWMLHFSMAAREL